MFGWYQSSSCLKVILKCFVPVAPNFYPVRVPKYMFYSGGNLNQESHYRVPFPLETRYTSDAKRPEVTSDELRRRRGGGGGACDCVGHNMKM